MFSRANQVLMLFLLSFFWVGCSQVSTAMPTSTLSQETETPSSVSSTSIAVVTSTSTPTLHLSPTVAATRTDTVTPTSSSTMTATNEPPIPSEARLQVTCLEILPTRPEELIAQGMLVLNNGDITSMLDLSTNEQIAMGDVNETLLYPAISPNRQWLAFRQVVRDESNTEIIEENLVIFTSDGQPAKVVPWDEQWGYINTWLNDQELVISFLNDESEETNDSGRAFLVVNPFTGEQTLLFPEFPEMYNNPFAPAFGAWESTIYDPSLTRVVYLQGDESTSGVFSYVLWDLQRDLSIASFDFIPDFYATPHWELSGERFAVAQSFLPDDLDDFGTFFQEIWPAYDIYIISRDGEKTQLTNLTSYYSRVHINDLSWAPDGNHIAFWFSHWFDSEFSYAAYGEQQLAIANMATGEVTNYCIPGNRDSLEEPRIALPPLWSPDSKQIAVVYTDPEGYRQIILVDIEQEIAVQISSMDLESGKKMDLVGWMVSPQE